MSGGFKETVPACTGWETIFTSPISKDFCVFQHSSKLMVETAVYRRGGARWFFADVTRTNRLPDEKDITLVIASFFDGDVFRAMRVTSKKIVSKKNSVVLFATEETIFPELLVPFMIDGDIIKQKGEEK